MPPQPNSPPGAVFGRGGGGPRPATCTRTRPLRTNPPLPNYKKDDWNMGISRSTCVSPQNKALADQPPTTKLQERRLEYGYLKVDLRLPPEQGPCGPTPHYQITRKTIGIWVSQGRLASPP